MEEFKNLQPNKQSQIASFAKAHSFSLAYIEGSFHLFYALKHTPFSYSIEHCVSADLREWKKLPQAVRSFSRIEGCTAFARHSKIFLLYTLGNLCELRLAVSKDGSSFLEHPNAVIKKSALCQPKVLYSEGNYYLLGKSRLANNKIVCFKSPNCVNWVPKKLNIQNYQAQNFDFPNFFTCGQKQYLSYTADGAIHFDAGITDMEVGTFVFEGKAQISDSLDGAKTLMLGVGRPMLYGKVGDTLVARKVSLDGSTLRFEPIESMHRFLHKNYSLENVVCDGNGWLPNLKNATEFEFRINAEFPLEDALEVLSQNNVIEQDETLEYETAQELAIGNAAVESEEAIPDEIYVQKQASPQGNFTLNLFCGENNTNGGAYLHYDAKRGTITLKSENSACGRAFLSKSIGKMSKISFDVFVRAGLIEVYVNGGQETLSLPLETESTFNDATRCGVALQSRGKVAVSLEYLFAD